MKPSSEQLLLKSVRRAKLLTNIALLFLALVILYIYGYYFFDHESFMSDIKMDYKLASVSKYRIWLFLLYFQIAVIPFFMAVWSLRRVFMGMNQPDIQLDNMISAAKRMAWCLWISVILLIFGDTIAQLIFYSGSSLLAEHGFFDIDIGLPDILAILAAIMATVMTHALRLGVELWQENKEII